MTETDTTVALDVWCIRRETKLAFQLILDYGAFVWMPKSQVIRPERFRAGDRNVLMHVAEWIAREKDVFNRWRADGFDDE